MTVAVSSNDTIELKGDCTVEDAEALLQRLLISPDASVEWSGCESAHTAVVQVLLVAQPVLLGTPRSSFLAEKIAPLIPRRR